MNKTILTMFLLLISAFLNSCQMTPSSNAEETNLSEQYQQLTTKLAQVQPLQPSTVTPSVVFIGIDQSGSMETARVSQTQLNDIEVILNVVSQTGGTVAISAICDRSDLPLVRTTFVQPPVLNVTSIPEPPQRPDTSKGSPFKHQEALKEYKKEVEKYEKQLTNIAQTITVYQETLNQYQAKSQENIDSIKPKIDAVLNHPRNCQSTDIQNSIQRANLVFGELGNWSQTPRKYAVFITDGLDSFSSQPAQVKADQVILVNGSNEMGIFQSIKHDRFESPNVALSHLALLIKAD